MNGLMLLAEFKYAIHLMPTIAAGTFAMNCGFLGIPCIGYNEADTQRKIHPKLSVDLGDLESARKLAIELKNNEAFYKECSTDARDNYINLISEAQFFNQNRKIILTNYERNINNRASYKRKYCTGEAYLLMAINYLSI